MREYQYHEWQTIDRPLTDKEQAQVNKLSSHIDVRSTGAWVEYSWGDFKHNPKQVLADYQGTQVAFEARLRQLTEQYARRHSLIAALKSAGLM